jgi:excisionase family DNA binding protein
MPQTIPAILSIKDVARLCSVATRTVHRWKEDGKLPTVTIGRRRLVKRVDFIEHALIDVVEVARLTGETLPEAGAARW